MYPCQKQRNPSHREMALLQSLTRRGHEGTKRCSRLRETPVGKAEPLCLAPCFLPGLPREHRSQLAITLILRVSSRKHCCHFEAQVYLSFSFPIQIPSFSIAWISLLQQRVPRPLNCTGHSPAWQITVQGEELFIFHTTFLLERLFFISLAEEGKGQQKGKTSPFFPLAQELLLRRPTFFDRK